MDKATLIEISHDSELNRIFTKAHYIEEAESSLSEGSMKFLLLEKIDKAEAKKVADALKGSREQITKIENYLNGLKSKGLDLGKIPSITQMIKDLGTAIDKAQGDFAAVNFDSGKVASFMGSKMTAPGIAKAAIAIQTKANQFLTGFTDALQNIEDNLIPLAKDDAVKNEPLRSIAGQGGIPDESKLEKGIKTAITKSLKPQGFLAKLKGFFAKNMPGAQGKILKSIPSLDVDAASQELTDALLDTSLSVFDAGDLKDTKVPMKDMEELAQDAAESEEKAGGPSGSGGKSSDEFDPRKATHDERIDFLLGMLRDANGGKLPNSFSGASEKEVEASLKDDAEDLAKGKDPKDVAEEAAEEGLQPEEGKEGEGSGAKWSELSKNYVDAAEDKAVAQKYVDSLKDDKEFQGAVSGKINVEETLASRRLLSFLFEDVPFDTLVKAADGASDDESVQDKLARSMANVLASAEVEVTGIPEEKKDEGPKVEVGEIYNYTTNKGQELVVRIEQIFDDGDVFAMKSDGKGGFKKPPFRFPASKLGEKIEGDAGASADEPSPAAPEEAKEEQQDAQAELEVAVKEEENQNQSPTAAALGALDAWMNGLSPTSQKSLNTKNRMDQLKGLVQTGLDKTAKSVERQVSTAIKKWRGEHEESLIKSKRFAKKNFDSLQQLIPQLVGSMIKKSNESRFFLNESNIEKIVFEFLNRKFYKDYDKILFEGDQKYSEESLIIRRMNRMAGLE